MISLVRCSVVQWMRSHWQSDKCYAQFGVDGSDCSFRVYLSEVETWCPLLKGRKPNAMLNQTHIEYKKVRPEKWGIVVISADVTVFSLL